MKGAPRPLRRRSRASYTPAVYLAGQQAVRHHQKWLKRKLETIEEAAIVGLAKRTRTNAP